MTAPILTRETLQHARRRRLGLAIAARRGELRLTQDQLATAAGMSVSAVRSAETGSHGISLDRLYPLSDALGWTVQVLLTVADMIGVAGRLQGTEPVPAPRPGADLDADR